MSTNIIHDGIVELIIVLLFCRNSLPDTKLSKSDACSPLLQRCFAAVLELVGTETPSMEPVRGRKSYFVHNMRQDGDGGDSSGSGVVAGGDADRLVRAFLAGRRLRC